MPHLFSQALVLSLLIVLSLSLLAASPARAQYPAGQWVVSPCDADGNLLSYNLPLDDKGFYVMRGTQDWTITHTYPSIIDYILSTPSEYNSSDASVLGAAYPIYLNEGNPPVASHSSNFIYAGLGYPARVGLDKVDAGNSTGGYNWWYSVYRPGANTPDIGTLNGSVTAELDGHLAYYFKVHWQSYSSDPTPPMLDHINLLLRSNVEAEASVAGSAGTPSIGEEAPLQNVGLWATATATDGFPFGEKASVGAGLDGNGASMIDPIGVPHVEGYHLVRAAVAAVDPMNGIASVYLNGTLKWQANNPIIYGTLDTSDPYRPFGIETNGPASARASGYITGGVRQDNREVTISCPEIETPTSYRKSYVDSTHQDGRWPNVRDTSTGNISVDTVVTHASGEYIASASPSGDRFIGQASNFTHPYYT